MTLHTLKPSEIIPRKFMNYEKINFPCSLVDTVSSEDSEVFQGTECANEIMVIGQMYGNFVLIEYCMFQCPRGPDKVLCLVRRDPREKVASRDGVISKVGCLWYNKVIVILYIVV